MTVLLIALPIILTTHFVVIFGTARFFNVGVKEFSIGAITVKKLDHKGVLYRFGLLPITGHVAMADSRQDAVDDDATDFARKPRIVRAVIFLSGTVFLLLIASILIGPKAFVEAVSGIPQFFLILFSYTKCTAHTIPRIFEFIDEQPVYVSFAYMATKVCALNLIPYPGTSGGQAIIELLNIDVKKHSFLTILTISAGGLSESDR